MFNTLLNVFKKSLPISQANADAALGLGGAFNPGSALDILKDMGWNRNTLDASGLGSLVLGTTLADTIYAPATGLNKLYGNAGNDQLFGNSANDELRGDAGNDTLTGGEGNDSLYGGNDNDAIEGGASSDLIDGGAGNDSLAGGAGADTIVGGTGDDTIIGGAGADNITDGGGIDKFIYNATAESTKTAYDTILSFNKGSDTLILTGLGFSSIDTDGGTTEAGELRFVAGGLLSDQVDFKIYFGGVFPLATDILF